MEPEGPLPHSQEPVTCPYPELIKKLVSKNCILYAVIVWIPCYPLHSNLQLKLRPAPCEPSRPRSHFVRVCYVTLPFSYGCQLTESKRTFLFWEKEKFARGKMIWARSVLKRCLWAEDWRTEIALCIGAPSWCKSQPHLWNKNKSEVTTTRPTKWH